MAHEIHEDERSGVAVLHDASAPNRLSDARAAGSRVSVLCWIDRLSAVLAVIAGIACVGMAANVVADVLLRSLTGESLPGTLDLTAELWMPAIISLSLGYALFTGEHLQVDLLTSRLGPTAKRVIDALALLVTLFIVVVLLWYSLQHALVATRLQEHAVGARWLTTWPSRWLTVLGLVGLSLQCVAELVRAIGSQNVSFAHKTVEGENSL